MGRLVFAFLLLDAALLAIIELMFLPMYVGSVPAPFSLLLAAVTTPWLVRSAGRIYPVVRLAALPLVVWAVTLFALGLLGPGGDLLLITSDWRSLALPLCGMLPAAFVLGGIPPVKPSVD
ncbi:hypothetical protein D5S17_27155 [Pseudonocardiaceae bacterium YIM PH 21723]|nr:hypothetical protein D5S17_27155 [Pseudonocardiaceae bacterium YIM PH 21723]